ncbi:hypothetical protein JOF56_003387 [Kibdelosporangium banguiense]|uniref:DUF11 domain-containing protein n=1 Tax=Kibdelosporangium banguiense TaxID=1365924 RepID=A0ABS4TF09_9PSEU|nr:hypothetical protein [Kibdelosporangium banguiense]MBP2323002.1 hypothetical protein [Kibdelosporangium banguiense]
MRAWVVRSRSTAWIGRPSRAGSTTARYPLITPDVNTGTVSNASGAAAAPAAGKEQPAAPTWGQRYTWKNGLAVEIPQPAECKPGEFATPEAKRAVKVTVKVTNGTDKPFETSVLTVGSEVQFAGAKAELLIDTEGGCKAGIGMESATVLPGATTAQDAILVLIGRFGGGRRRRRRGAGSRAGLPRRRSLSGLRR